MDLDQFWVVMGGIIILYGMCTFFEMPFTTKQMLETYTEDSVHKYCKQAGIPMALFGVAFIIDSYSKGNLALTIVKYALYVLGGIPLLYCSFKTLQRKQPKNKK